MENIHEQITNELVNDLNEICNGSTNPATAKRFIENLRTTEVFATLPIDEDNIANKMCEIQNYFNGLIADEERHYDWEKWCVLSAEAREKRIEIIAKSTYVEMSSEIDELVKAFQRVEEEQRVIANDVEANGDDRREATIAHSNFKDAIALLKVASRMIFESDPYYRP